MRAHGWRGMAAAGVGVLGLAAAVAFAVAQAPVRDPARDVIPPAAPKASKPSGPVLFKDDFQDGKLDRWSPSRPDAWDVRRGMLRADLPDKRQEYGFLYAGSIEWTDIALEVDVYGVRGVDKGVAVRVEEDAAIGVDLRGPGYHDVLLHRGHWPMGKTPVINANGAWHRLRVEARGHRYRVFVDGALLIDKVDGRQTRARGRIALAAYTGGVGECTLWYDNVRVEALTEGTEAEAAAAGR